MAILKAQACAMGDPIAQFKAAMQASGLTPPDVIEPSKLHRFPTNGKHGDDAGWCKLFPDMRGGVFGDHRSGLSEHWSIKAGRAMSDPERKAFWRQVVESKRQAKAEEQKRHEAAAQKAAAILETATGDPTTHPYVIKKKSVPLGPLVKRGAWPQRSWPDALLIPIYGADGRIWSIEAINADGDKDFLAGGKTGGGFHPFGKIHGAGRVLIGEGVASVAACVAATGLPATAALSAGNLKATVQAVRELAPDAAIIILADNDVKLDGGNPGMTAAMEAARAAGGRVAVPFLNGRKCDFWDMWAECGAEAVRAAIANAKPPGLTDHPSGGETAPAGNFEGHDWPERKPLQRELPLATPFPMDALGDVLAPAARKMQAIIQAPTAICGNSVLAAAALAVQAHADVVIDGRVFPVSEIFLTIGESGERKSSVDKAALWPHRKHERNLCEQYKQNVIAYQRDREAYDKAKLEALSSRQNKSLDAKRRALEELGAAPLPPLEPLLLCEEPTYEGLVKLLAAGQPSVGLFSDEGGRFIGGHGMNPDNLLKTAAGMSGLWDGKPIDRVRGGDGATKLYGRRVSCHLMVQPEVSQLMLSNSVLIAQGLLSRCLVTWPESTAGTRFYREEDLSASPEITKYNARMLATLETSLPLAEGARNELNPRQLPLALNAKRLWISFHDHVETQLADGGELAPIRGLGNKAPEHAARLAGVLALVEDLYCACIRLEHMKAGIELVTHYLNEALRLYEAGIQDPTLALAQKLLDWLKAKGKAIITLPEIYQHGPKPIRTATKARELMAILVEHGEAAPFDESAEYRGKRYFEAWRVRL